MRSMTAAAVSRPPAPPASAPPSPPYPADADSPGEGMRRLTPPEQPTGGPDSMGVGGCETGSGAPAAAGAVTVSTTPPSVTVTGAMAGKGRDSRSPASTLAAPSTPIGASAVVRGGIDTAAAAAAASAAAAAAPGMRGGTPVSPTGTPGDTAGKGDSRPVGVPSGAPKNRSPSSPPPPSTHGSSATEGRPPAGLPPVAERSTRRRPRRACQMPSRYATATDWSRRRASSSSASMLITRPTGADTGVGTADPTPAPPRGEERRKLGGETPSRGLPPYKTTAGSRGAIDPGTRQTVRTKKPPLCHCIDTVPPPSPDTRCHTRGLAGSGVRIQLLVPSPS